MFSYATPGSKTDFQIGFGRRLVFMVDYQLVVAIVSCGIGC